MWIMGVLFLLSIAALMYIDERKQSSYGGVTGVKTNSDRLKTEAPQEGLQENDNDQTKQQNLDPGTTEGKGEQQMASIPSKSSEGKNNGVRADAESKGKGVKGILADKNNYTEEDLNRLGWQAVNGNAPDEALVYFRAVLELQPEHFHSNAGLGKAYELLGKKQDAGKQYCNTASLPALSVDDREYWRGVAEQVGVFCK